MAWITDLYNRMDSFKDVIGVKLNYLNAQLATKVNLNGGNATGNLASAISRQHDAVTLGSNSTGLFLAAQVISLAAGYAIPTVAQINNWNDPYTSGENITIQSDKKVDMRFENNSWIRSKDGKPRIYFGTGGSTTDDTYFKRGYLGGEFWFLDADDSPLMKIGAGGVMRIYQLAGSGGRLLQADTSGSIFATNIDVNDIATVNWVSLYYAQSDGGNLTNIPNWQNVLGISGALSLNLQQITNNGNTTSKPLIVGNVTYGTGSIFKDTDLSFLTNGGSALRILTGGLLVSSDYVDANLIPTSGIYSKGAIATENHYTSAEWATAYNIATTLQNNIGNYVNKAGDTMSGLLKLPRLQVYNSGNGNERNYFIETNVNTFGDLGIISKNATETDSFRYDVVIYGNGNVGIGETNPQAKLHVNGNIITDNATASNHAVAFGQLGNYALTNGSNTIGGNWSIDSIHSPSLGSSISNPQIFSTNVGDIYFGNPSASRIILESVNTELFHYRAGLGNGIVFTTHNFNPADYALNDGSNLTNIANWRAVLSVPTNNNQLANGAGYTTLPIVQSWIGKQGYLTSFTETDPTVPSHVKGISTSDIAYWNAKFTFPGGGSPNQYINYQGVWTNLPGGGCGGIVNISTDYSPNPGPTSSQVPIYFASHEAYGKPTANVVDGEEGNGVMEVTSGDYIKFWMSHDTIKTDIVNGNSHSIDIDGERKHIYNVLFMNNGGTLTFPNGIYTGDQIKVTTQTGGQLNLGGNNIISPVGLEFFTFVNLIWDVKLGSWVTTSYGQQ